MLHWRWLPWLSLPQVGEQEAASSLQPMVSEVAAPTPYQHLTLLRNSIGKTFQLQLNL